jgi:hypothetical protein
MGRVAWRFPWTVEAIFHFRFAFCRIDFSGGKQCMPPFETGRFPLSFLSMIQK